jgi:hypothetical protein
VFSNFTISIDEMINEKEIDAGLDEPVVITSYTVVVVLRARSSSSISTARSLFIHGQSTSHNPVAQLN